jgi:esterase/lipase
MMTLLAGVYHRTELGRGRHAVLPLRSFVLVPRGFRLLGSALAELSLCCYNPMLRESGELYGL